VESFERLADGSQRSGVWHGRTSVYRTTVKWRSYTLAGEASQAFLIVKLQ
jgi:hypothetical protein